jgi:hypothetical protein
MSETPRCYICKRNSHEVADILKIENIYARKKLVKMAPHEIKAEAFFDKQGKQVYFFNDWDILYKNRNQLRPRVHEWYDSMEESGGRDDAGISVYIHEKSTWAFTSLDDGGLLIDDSMVDKITIKYVSHICPVCENSIMEIARLV